jgi:hypothetical protein
MSDEEKEKKNARDNLIHSGEFTKHENDAGVGFVLGWIAQASRQPEETLKAANTFWTLRILHEHYTSTLNPDVPGGGRTDESRAVQAELKERAAAAKARLKELSANDDDFDDVERMNQLTDTTVQEVLDKLGLVT